MNTIVITLISRSMKIGVNSEKLRANLERKSFPSAGLIPFPSFGTPERCRDEVDPLRQSYASRIANPAPSGISFPLLRVPKTP
jgi:hypothetical protein